MNDGIIKKKTKEKTNNKEIYFKFSSKIPTC